MALLIQTNPIVTTYPMYIVIMSEEYNHVDIYDWLKQYTNYVGIGATYSDSWTLAYRVFVKLEPKIESLFILKYGAQRRFKKKEPVKLFDVP